MASFGDLPADDGGDETSSSDDEEYLPENDSDADGDTHDDDDVEDDQASGDEDAAKAAKKLGKPVVGGRKANAGGGRRKCAVADKLTCRRARRGGIRIEGEDQCEGEGESPAAETTSVTKTGKSPPEVVEDDARAKERADALWASFLSDVGPRRPSSSVSTATAQAVADRTPAVEKPAVPKAVTTTTTKVFDFAGESVTVEVPAPAASAAAAGKRPPAAVSSGVRSLLDSLSKRPKLSTLEKSRLDWEKFKSAEGIAEDLAAHNRGKAGYLDRRAFLERADYRQFERERDARLASSSRKPS